MVCRLELHSLSLHQRSGVGLAYTRQPIADTEDDVDGPGAWRRP